MALTKLSLMPQANVTAPCSQLITHNGIMVHKPPVVTCQRRFHSRKRIL